MLKVLDKMEIFYYVATLNSFSQAARELGISKAYVSMQINQLETGLKAKLIHRTTRHLSLTEAGNVFFQSCQKIVVEQKKAKAAIECLQGEPSGHLRVSATPSFASTILLQILPDFLKRYPKLSVHIEATDALHDPTKDDVDVVLRLTRSPSEHLVAALLCQTHFLVCASPHYFKNAVQLNKPADLLKHNCLIHTTEPNSSYWEFNQAGQTEEIEVHGNFASNSLFQILHLAIEGHGVARIPNYILKNKNWKARLQIALKDYQQPSLPLYASYPSVEYASPKIKCFITYLTNYFKPE